MDARSRPFAGTISNSHGERTWFDVRVRGVLRVIVVLVLVPVVGLLTGCIKFLPFDGPIPEPVAMSTDSRGQLVVVVCSAVSGVELSAEHREQPDMVWREFWDVTADYELVAGQSITAGAQVANEVLPPSPQIGPGDEVVVAFITRSGINNLVPLFRVPREGLQPGEWLQYDGAVTSAPCPPDAAQHVAQNSSDGLG